MRILSFTLAISAFVASTMGLASWEKWGQDYEVKSATQKQDELWSQVISNTQPNKWYNPVEFAGIFIESMSPSIQWVGDTFKNEWTGARAKYIHTVGNTGKVKFVPAANSEGYTGIFAGADHGIIRLSCAVQPDFSKKTAAQADGNFVPGFGLKFLRDGVPSANLVAMYGVDGVPTWNFFKYDFSNHIPNPRGSGQKALGQKFATATPLIQSVGLSDMASFDQHGAKVANPKFPFQLVFEADGSLKSRFTDDFSENFQDQLAKVASGSHLYTVYARSGPDANKVHIGDIYLTSQLSKSYFGDRYLFFKHQDMQEDVKLRPDWKGHVSLSSSNGCPLAKAKGFFTNISNLFSQVFGLF